MTDVLLQIAALEALGHAKKYGDVGLCQRLYQEVSRTRRTNGEKLKYWFAKFGPLTAHHGIWCLKKGWERSQFDFEGAAKTSIGTRGTAISFQHVLSRNAWPAYAERLHELSHAEILAIQQACNEALVFYSAKSIMLQAREDIEAEWRRRISDNNYFVWPKLFIVPGTGHLTFMDVPDIGMFVAMGYRVGKVHGRPEKLRLGILDYIYHAQALPPLNSRTYVEKWASPQSDQRLRMMAYGLARASWKAQSRVMHDLSLAISQWSDDLEYLRERYHRRRFEFPSSCHSGCALEENDRPWTPHDCEAVAKERELAETKERALQEVKEKYFGSRLITAAEHTKMKAAKKRGFSPRPRSKTQRGNSRRPSS
jgi:hypothetical protein